MLSSTRRKLLEAFQELSALNPAMRLGQWIANLAPNALGGFSEAIWDVEDDELLAEVQQPLTYFRDTRPEQAAACAAGPYGRELLVSPARRELLEVLQEVSECCDWRLGQLLANLATAARLSTVHHGFPEAVYDAEDEELLPAARKLLEYFRTMRPERAASPLAAAAAE